MDIHELIAQRRAAQPATSAEAIQALEHRLRLSLPHEFREFLLELNGGTFNRTHIDANGCSEILSKIFSVAEPGTRHALGYDIDHFDMNAKTRQILPFGYGFGGTLFAVVVQPGDACGAVLYLSPSQDEFGFLASSFDEFLALIKEGEGC